MNAFLTVSLCLCALAVLSEEVTVKVGDFAFPLESVKKLKDLSKEAPTPRLRSAASVCDNPELPAEFKPICASRKSRRLVPQLQSIAREAEVCEICANVACSGC